MALKTVLVWLLLAAAETLHGIARVKWLNRRLGAHRANQVGVGTGSVLILGIGWFAVPWIAPISRGEAWAVGAAWVALMLGYELILGRAVFRRPWPRLAAEFDPRQGGFLGLGMVLLGLTPWIVAVGRGLF